MNMERIDLGFLKTLHVDKHALENTSKICDERGGEEFLCY